MNGLFVCGEKAHKYLKDGAVLLFSEANEAREKLEAIKDKSYMLKQHAAKEAQENKNEPPKEFQEDISAGSCVGG